jgi:hypothetical protein
MLRSAWLKHGFWNTLEHAVTRVSDALTTLVLLWALVPEVFSRLAIAQAWVAPLLLVFISPEAVLYRDFGKWRSEGADLFASRLRALRLFAWGKAQLALVLSFAAAFFVTFQGAWFEKFSALVWAFSLALAPQVAGPDREFLRLDLKLKELCVLSLFQKAVLFGGTITAALVYQGKPMLLPALAAVAALSAIGTAFVARFISRRVLVKDGAGPEFLSGRKGIAPLALIQEAVRTFSIWSHVQGVISNWIQTMDVFLLGVFGLPARMIGLYAASLKLANFSMAMPLALSNLFSVWIGRRIPSDEGRTREKREVRRFTFILLAANIAQAALLLLIAPWAFKALSHGRWTEAEQTMMLGWLFWILLGSIGITSNALLGSWLVVRASIVKMFFWISLPWLAGSVIAYALVIRAFGFDGAAKGNAIVAVIYLVLLALFIKLRRLTQR